MTDPERATGSPDDLDGAATIDVTGTRRVPVGRRESSILVDAAELAAWLRQGESFTVLDVRNRDEFDQWHVSGPSVEAVHTPHQKFIAARVQGTTTDLVPDGPEPVVVICAVGEASAEVAAQLRQVDVDARNLAGGMEAWARQYDSVEIPCAGATVLQYRRPSSGCLAYLVVGPQQAEVGDAEDENRSAAVIDPLRAFTDRYVEDAAALGATVRYAIDTHVHADHVSGVRAVADETGAEVVLPAGVAERGLSYQDYDPRFVADGDKLTLGDATATGTDTHTATATATDTVLEALELPGHTREMTGFRFADEEHGDLLFGGDTLFLTSVARPDLAAEDDGDVTAMARMLHGTLTELGTFPENTRLAPGHVSESTIPGEDGSYVSTLGALRHRLDLLALAEEEFVARVTESLPVRPANDAEIRAINLGGQEVTSEKAFDVELGPNNCAAE